MLKKIGIVMNISGKLKVSH